MVAWVGFERRKAVVEVQGKMVGSKEIVVEMAEVAEVVVVVVVVEVGITKAVLEWEWA